ASISMPPIPALKFALWSTRSMMGQCSSGRSAIRRRRSSFEAARNLGWLVVAHNDQFESAIEQHILAPRFGFPLIPPERHRCTMAAALALGLPAKLKTIADVMEFSNRKDVAGERLMHQMSKPRRPHKDEDPNGGPYWFDDPERMARLEKYCMQDGEV